MVAYGGLIAGLTGGAFLVALAIEHEGIAAVCGVIFALLIWGMHR